MLPCQNPALEWGREGKPLGKKAKWLRSQKLIEYSFKSITSNCQGESFRNTGEREGAVSHGSLSTS